MHFDSFGPAMLTIFMAMIGGWVDPMSFAFDVVGLASVIFFVLVVVVPAISINLRVATPTLTLTLALTQP